MNDRQEPDAIDIASMTPVAESPVFDVAEATSEMVVVQKPKKGLGLAAFFSQAPVNMAEMENSSRAVFGRDCPEVIKEEMAFREAVDVFGEQEPIPLHKNGHLNQVLESILFVADGPLPAKQLAEMLELEESRIELAMNQLEAQLDARGGIQLMRVAGGFQLCTRPEYADYCTILLQPGKKRLSKAALETLAVVAYRQPCTMPEVEAVRGVSVSGVMKTLSERGLVKEAGKKQSPGRPTLFITTPEFLEYFGLNELAELPDIDLLAVEEVQALEAQRDLFTGQYTHADGGGLEEEIQD